MSKKASKKAVVARLLVSFLSAALMFFLAVYFLKGPKLLYHYDRLMEMRSRYEPSTEILLINTGKNETSENVIETHTAASLIMTLTEFDADSLLIQVPILGVSTSGSLSESELIYRFDEEFNLVDTNIKKLFDGIRTGSIEPKESVRYVNEVLRLTERGKERLLQAAVHSDDALASQLENSSKVFGSVYIPGDISVDVIRAENSQPSTITRLYSPVFSKVRPDSDGVIRRIPPVIFSGSGQEYEHIAFSALKKRFKDCTIEESSSGSVLKINSSTEEIIQLDRNGALIFDLPESIYDFRKIQLSVFLAYDEADKMLYRLLSEGSSLARYTEISPEKYPTFLYERSNFLRDELLQNPNDELKHLWIDSRLKYFDSLSFFFDESSNMKAKIITSFSNLEKNENLSQSGKEQIAIMRNEQLQMYDTADELYQSLVALRDDLSKKLVGSFCILGALSDAEENNNTIKDAEVSALLANSILTFDVITPAPFYFILFWSLFSVLFSILLMTRFSFAQSLFFCLIMTSLSLIVFSVSFLITSFWIDPAIPALCVMTGTFSQSLFALAGRRRYALHIKNAVGVSICEKYLKAIIASNAETPLCETTENASIIVVRNPRLSAMENRKNAEEFNVHLQKFRNEVCSIFLEAGAAILNCDSESVTAAFGSSLEKTALSYINKKKPKRQLPLTTPKTSEFVISLFKTKQNTYPWAVGIDSGECVFYYSPETGYTAAGSPMLRAKLLAALCYKYNAGILISKDACQNENIPQTSLRTVENGSERKDLFYELITL